MNIDSIINKLINVGYNLLWAIIIIIVGFKLTQIIIKLTQKGRAFNKLDKTVRSFILNFLNIILKALVLVMSASVIGIPMTSIITLIGSASLALGLALQGGLSNLAGGLMLLIFRPFKIGDFINVSSCSGTVNDISLFYTSITTNDNKKIMLPNGNLSNSIITNYSALPKRRIDMSFSVSYSSNIEKVKNIIKDLINENQNILKDEEVFVRLKEHGSSALIFEVRVWVKKEDYFNVTYDLNESIKNAFDKEKIEIPYQIIDVNLKKN